MTELKFPQGFGWGTSSSSYQIEGAVAEGGRSPSIWDEFGRLPGRIADGSTGDIAANHYHLWQQDLDMIADAGLKIYRFSVSWPRLFPDASGQPNEAGFAFYDQIIDGCIARGIEPWLCLYHWDLPAWLQRRGGWMNRDIAGPFAQLAEACGTRWGDKIAKWIMINEHTITSWLGHLTGEFAPGFASEAACLAAVHHQNLAQGAALSTLRRLLPKAELGTVFIHCPALPETPADQPAADMADALLNDCAYLPVLEGRYPGLLADRMALLIEAGDMAAIHQPIDFLGLNFYARGLFRTDHAAPLGFVPSDQPLTERQTALGWEWRADSLFESLMTLSRRFPQLPIWITENGACVKDPAPDANGEIHDTQRCTYLTEYLSAAHRAIAAGADLRGYLVWSWCDNFEWSRGLSARFGLVHVDYASLERTPKQSWHLYSQIARQNAVDAA